MGLGAAAIVTTGIWIGLSAADGPVATTTANPAGVPVHICETVACPTDWVTDLPNGGKPVLGPWQDKATTARLCPVIRADVEFKRLAAMWYASGSHQTAIDMMKSVQADTAQHVAETPIDIRPIVQAISDDYSALTALVHAGTEHGSAVDTQIARVTVDSQALDQACSAAGDNS